jgi:hypothetical protein
MSCCSDLPFPLPHGDAMEERGRVRGRQRLSRPAFRNVVYSSPLTQTLSPGDEVAGGEAGHR